MFVKAFPERYMMGFNMTNDVECPFHEGDKVFVAGRYGTSLPGEIENVEWTSRWNGMKAEYMVRLDSGKTIPCTSSELTSQDAFVSTHSMTG